MSAPRRARTTAATLATLAVLAACGAPSQPQSPPPANQSANGAAPPIANAVGPAPPPAPDPASDHRPDKVKLADFLARIESQQVSLAAADGNFLRGVRIGLQSGSDSGPTIAQAAYQTELGRELTALPPAPRLAACYARSESAGERAAAAAAAMLTDRQGKLGAVHPSADAPLSLADFGPLATDVASTVAGDAIKADIAAARAAVVDCIPKPKSLPRRAASHPVGRQDTDDRFERQF